MSWFDRLLDETVNIKRNPTMDEWGESTYSEDISVKCKILNRESEIKLNSGTIHKSNHLVVSNKELKQDD